MTDQESLLATIHATPDDDVVRLIYADEIEACGESERAEFIRNQIEFDREHAGRFCRGCSALTLEPRPDCRNRRCVLIRRNNLLLNGFAPDGEIIRNVCHWDCNGWTEYSVRVWHRGFVHTVRGPLDLLRQHLPAIVREHPVERVEVTDKRPLRFTPDSGSASFDWPDRFTWHYGFRHYIPDEYSLPEELWIYLPPAGGKRSRYKNFDDLATALAVLGLALLAEARDRNALAVQATAKGE